MTIDGHNSQHNVGNDTRTTILTDVRKRIRAAATAMTVHSTVVATGDFGEWQLVDGKQKSHPATMRPMKVDAKEEGNTDMKGNEAPITNDEVMACSDKPEVVACDDDEPAKADAKRDEGNTGMQEENDESDIPVLCATLPLPLMKLACRCWVQI